jgi:HPt (histidine-containing phosphotransfer) domain-containing protein
MKATDRSREARISPIFAKAPFVELRRMYIAGLRADRIRLVNLAESLARVADNAETTFAEIRRVAHKMRGAAAIFEAPMVACAAAALEDAAHAAWHQDARNSDLRIYGALENLVECVARLAGSNTA